MDSNQRFWNQQQQELRQALLHSKNHQKAIELFLNQHAMLHSATVAQSELWSFEDEVLNDMSEEHMRRIPRNCLHSVAWLIWHIARIEDVTMNLLVAGTPQVLHRDQWLERMKVEVRDVGTEMDEAGAANLGAKIDVVALRAYRVAVGRRTREIVKQLSPEELQQRVEPSRLQQVIAEGAVVEAALGLIDFWGRRKIAGLLLMPATRHSFTHLNEARRVKQRCR